MKKKTILLCLVFLAGCISSVHPTPAIISTSLPRSSTFTPTVSSILENTSQLLNSVMVMLNNGQEIAEIIAELDERPISLQSYAADFNGDGIIELFFAGTLREDVGEDEWIKNIFWIVSPSQNGYSVVFTLSPDLFLYQGNIHDLGDLNGDGLPDILVASNGYGNLCHESLFIFGWRSTGYTSYQAEAELCIMAIDVIENNKLVITGSPSQSLGSGPRREMEVVLTLQNGQYQQTQVTLLPSNVRIHVLQDAQNAFDGGNYDLALVYWDKAAHDNTLVNFPSLQMEQGQDQPEIYQPVYALYRMYALYVFLGDEQSAQVILDNMRTLYPESEPGGEFIEISHKIAALLATSHDPDVVCPEIYEYISITYPAIRIDHWYWGDANLNIVELCPLP